MADQLDLDFWLLTNGVSRCQTQEHMGSTLGRGPMKLTMGGSRDSCKGTRYSAIQRICMQSEAYKTCEGWATGDSDVAFPTNVTTRSES
jgi:hypothetical protein